MDAPDMDRVEVRAEHDVELGFGRIWGRSRQRVVAAAAAVPCEGIDREAAPC